MAAKKKSAPKKPAAKSKAPATSAKKAKASAKPSKAAKPAKSKASPKAKPAKAQPIQPAKTEAASAPRSKSAKPAVAAKTKLPASAKTKSASTTKSAKPAPAAKSAQPTLKDKVKQVAKKVAAVAATAAIKLLDSDAGRPAPTFELSDEKGEAVSSSTLAGKPYLLYFYPKDDTPGCTKEACDIRDSFARFGQQGLRVLGVSPDSTQSHAKFGKKYGLPFTLLSDPDKTLASAYGVWGEKNNYGKKYMGIVRSSFLIGADGTIKKSYRGVKVNGHVDAVLEDAKALL